MKKVLIIGGTLMAIHIVLSELRKKSPSITYVEKMPFGYNAMTIPPFGIIIDEKEKENIELLNHELIHWKQYQSMGLGYYVNYAIGSIKYGYDAHPMELEARSNETEYCKKNYTACVRNGLARTVKDKHFRL